MQFDQRTTDMNEGLMRQRRNLMITSAVLWVLAYGDVSIDSVTAAGISVKLVRPNAFLLALWAAFWYFLIRYYQYFSTHAQPILQELFASTVRQIVNDLAYRAIKGRFGGLGSFSRQIPSFADVLVRRKEIHVYARPGERLPVAFRLERLSIMCMVISRLFRVGVSSTYLSDYLLPFVFSLSVLGYAASADWNGGYSQLLASSLLPNF